ncbi:helix-turn-helix transcriptional regulator [Streptomyces daliensis]|uniref:Helix-turn-helix transcriptional regulator n=1 Tax=Streptomyces daliensis TaxID=299421 RepID=A0A8T4IRH0_9ACTN|nr:helix-turn-helix transcriptional regulator [Streptomyces daliensis]
MNSVRHIEIRWCVRGEEVTVATSQATNSGGDAENEPPLAAVEALKALANPARLQIMDWLRDPHGEFAQWEPIADRDEVGVCVSHLQAKSGLAQSTVSSYMATLERAGLVQATRVGKWIHYKRNEGTLSRLAEMLRGT